MVRSARMVTVFTVVLLQIAVQAVVAEEPVSGFLTWRGENQNSETSATQLPQRAVLEGEGANLRWTLDMPGRGTPVIGRYSDGDRLFVIGYDGSGPDLLETLLCLDPATGEEHWRLGYADFISDIVYNRYAISAPTIDPATGHVYFMTSPGLLISVDKDGQERWRISMMESFGRLTFPNGRTGCVTVEGDLILVNAITSNWGTTTPARSRFYAFNKDSGELVWFSTPGVGPPFLKDSSFSTPMLETRRGIRLFYAGTGCGNLVAVNALNGQPLWRYQMSKGGVNCSPVVHPGEDGQMGTDDDLVIQTHGKENVRNTGTGYMIAIRAGDALDAALASEDKPVKLDDSHAVWQNDDVSMFTSSPTLVGDTVFQCTIDGHLYAINALTGETRWREKVGGDQLHATPLFAEGRLYAPFWNDGLFIITPGDDGPTNVEHTELEGQSIGSPAVYNGKVYVHTTKKLYCFGADHDVTTAAAAPAGDTETGKVTGLRVVPAEFLIRPGATQSFTVTATDAQGYEAPGEVVVSDTAKWIPPTARVRVELSGEVEGNSFVASEDGQPSAGALRVTSDTGLTGTARGRVMSTPPFSEDFEALELSATDPGDGGAYAHPPLPWIGARAKWQVRDLDGNKVLAKTLTNVLFQRSMAFIGHPDDSGYTVTADVMTDGSRRLMSVVGVVNQRYIIALDGNKQAIEVSSNHDRVKQAAPFTIKPKVWYTLKTRVEVLDDGSGVVKGKAWPRGEEEPAGWVIEAAVPNVHKNGSPGLFGFSPQSRYKVYIDAIRVTPND